MQREGVWYTSVAPGAHRLFRGRHYQRLALDEGRVIVSTRRRGEVLLDLPVDALELTGVRNGLLFQVRARDQMARTHVFEFRPRRHGTGRTLADALR
jgi:hypothetical protein